MTKWCVKLSLSVCPYFQVNFSKLTYAQETLSRSPLTSIENTNSQINKKTITANSYNSNLWATLAQALGMEFSWLSFPMSPQDRQPAAGGKNSRIRQGFIGPSIQISFTAGAPSHGEKNISNTNGSNLNIWMIILKPWIDSLTKPLCLATCCLQTNLFLQTKKLPDLETIEPFNLEIQSVNFDTTEAMGSSHGL